MISGEKIKKKQKSTDVSRGLYRFFGSYLGKV